MPAAAARDGDRAAVAAKKPDVRAHSRRCLWMVAKLVAMVALLSAIAPRAAPSGEASCDALGGGDADDGGGGGGAPRHWRPWRAARAVAPAAVGACDAGGEEARLAARRAALEAWGGKASLPRVVRSLLPEFPALGVTALSYLETCGARLVRLPDLISRTTVTRRP